MSGQSTALIPAPASTSSPPLPQSSTLQGRRYSGRGSGQQGSLRGLWAAVTMGIHRSPGALASLGEGRIRQG